MDALGWLGAVIGGTVLAAGGWLLAVGRARFSRTNDPLPGAWRLIGVGMALAGVGYHVLAWSLPASWAPMCVPLERWWIVGAVAAVVALGTWRMEDARPG